MTLLRSPVQVQHRSHLFTYLTSKSNIRLVTPQIEKHLKANMTMRKRDIMAANFLGGLAWGLGSVIGATVVVALLIWILSIVNFIPIIGNFTAEIVNIVTSKQMK